jgi:hypothetical protein
VPFHKTDFALETKIIFAIFKMRATFNHWVRRLIGKPSVPYNRRLPVRGWPHPLIYDDGLSIAATRSNAFRNQSGLSVPERRIAALISFASGGVTRTANNSPLAFCMPSLGLPARFFIIFVNEYR